MLTVNTLVTVNKMLFAGCLQSVFKVFADWVSGQSIDIILFSL